MAARAKAASRLGVEAAWALGFAAAGRLYRPCVAAWSSPGGQRVLAIAPHPDDEVMGCAGTLAQHVRCGDCVCVAYVSDGRSSRAWGLGPAEMASRRRQEAQVAAEALRIDRVEWLGLPEGGWTAEQLGPQLGALLDAFSPDVIYAPSRIDFHPEHHRVARTLAALLSNRRDAVVRVYQVQVPLTPVLTNLVAATASVMPEIHAAFQAYATQRDSIARAFRMRRYAARFYGAEKQAEEFWQMSAAQCCRLHSLPPAEWSIHTFRSLRPHPASDPLAYLHGLGERRRLRGLIQ